MDKMVSRWWEQRDGGAEKATLTLSRRLYSLRNAQLSSHERPQSSDFFSSVCCCSVNVQHGATGCGI